MIAVIRSVLFQLSGNHVKFLLPRVYPGSHDKANLNRHFRTRLVCRRPERLCRLPNADATHLDLSARTFPDLPDCRLQLNKSRTMHNPPRSSSNHRAILVSWTMYSCKRSRIKRTSTRQPIITPSLLPISQSTYRHYSR